MYRKLYEKSGKLNEREREKRELYHDVLKYVKTEVNISVIIASTCLCVILLIYRINCIAVGVVLV